MSEIGVQYSGTGMSAAVLMPPMDEPPPAVPLDVQPHEVEFRQLQGQREIGRIIHLREEIKLPASALGDAGFAAREKKEMKSGWWAPSSGSANTSVPSGCFP